MQQTLEHFLKALRGFDVPVSVAESIEAHRTAELVGWDSREHFRDALAITVAKSEEEKERFFECFDLFFQVEDLDSSASQSSDDNPAQGDEASPEAPSDMMDDGTLAEMLMAGDRASLTAALAAAAQRADLSQIRLFTQRGVFMRRILEDMGIRDLEAKIREFLAAEAPDEQALGQQLDAARTQLIEDTQNLVERNIAIYADPASERLREEFLENMRMNNIPPRDFVRVRNLVRRIAKKLAARHAHRKLNKKDRTLDVRKVIRTNVANDGILFNLAWKYPRIDRPKIVAICDVSGSVAAAAQFLLLFLYSLNEVLSDLKAFAFSSHLVEVSDILNQKSWDDAVPAILKDIGFRPTDYGQTLLDLKNDHLDAIDRRTTVIILGDGRNNDGEPQTEILQLVSQRCKRLVWLNPEPKPFWGTGDSEMLRYQPHCHLVRVCNTIKHLERLIDDLLSNSMRVS
jgi:uncharacterized protein with von Willebrand factor type A (vWA) domain